MVRPVVLIPVIVTPAPTPDVVIIPVVWIVGFDKTTSTPVGPNEVIVVFDAIPSPETPIPTNNPVVFIPAEASKTFPLFVVT